VGAGTLLAVKACNHAFYWQSMRPKGGGPPPSGDLAQRIDRDFGGHDKFKAQFVQTAIDHFSNGWVWLVLDKGKLKLLDTHDADTALLHGGHRQAARRQRHLGARVLRRLQQPPERLRDSLG
jgi:superoxide dismutase